jgi:hypothetical protein
MCFMSYHFQVITKLLYLLNQGETFTKVILFPYHSFWIFIPVEDPCFFDVLLAILLFFDEFLCALNLCIELAELCYCVVNPF